MSLPAVEAAIAAAEAHAHLNLFVTPTLERARRAAAAAATGRLAGVPLVVKDLMDVAGVRTTYGSRVFAEHVPEASAQAVLRAEAEGAVVVGMAGCDEFAWGLTGHNAHHGAVRNPRRPDRIAGGSSAGSAAALAAGVAPFALGTDTGGSVRVPAACCGVVGYKPPWGVVPVEGVWPLCPSFDTVGPMARTVADVVRLAEVLTGAPAPPPAIAGRTVGVLCAHPDLAAGGPPPPRDERALGFAARLEALGARCMEVALPAPALDPHLIFQAEAVASHAGLYPERRDEYGPALRAKLDAARRVASADVAAAREALADWRERAAREPDVDLLVSPTLGLTELPPHDVDERDVRVPLSAYTRPFNYLGWPALAIGGMQLAGRDPDVVLAAGLAWEEAFGPTAAGG